MPQYETTWVEAPEIEPQDEDRTCKQVYVWILTKDKHCVVVSKDGDHWQLPGGKPEPGETMEQTAIREVYEETGLDISSTTDDLHFIGYQTVKELGSDEPPYLQARFLLELAADFSTLELGSQREDTQQPPEDVIRYVGAVSLDELAERIPWLENSAEFATVKSLIEP